MRTYDNAAAIVAAPETVTDRELKRLLTDRIHDWTVTGLLDLTHLLIVEAGDTEQDILSEVAFSPLVNHGHRFGSSEFVSPWDWFEKHEGWFELVFTVANDGFAFILFVRDDEGVDPNLLSLCRGAGRSIERKNP